jgi:alkanesulfonate monooxygenase SsuD/methylene tetrahydromethanopterin reductase-like flavin-dependent oxidoreductase (luciferase family)
VGIGLPSALPGVEVGLVTTWARAADEGPFASVGAVDRIVYECLEPLVALSAAAAVTERVELVTSILIAPLRETSTVVKQVLSLQALSRGRLTLGVAIGARGDDYDRSEFGRAGRGDRLTEQLAQLRALTDEGAISAPGSPDRPRILVGGGAGPSYARMASLADGWFHGGSSPRSFARAVGEARAAWVDAGRPGEPEIWSMAYYALGGTEERGRDYMLDYYGFTGAFAERIADQMLTSPLELREYLEAYADAGCDHLVLFPTVPEIDQLQLLADAVGDASTRSPR